MIITIDGPAGSGKTTTAKLLKDELNKEYKDKNFIVLDTGAIFRSFTIYLKDNFKYIDLLPEEILNHEEERKELINVLDNIDFKIDIDKYFLFGKDITKDIRDMKNMKYLSNVSASKDVRLKILEIERKYVADKNIVVEGRDTGSVVFPNAEFKFYLDADKKERAYRRFLQNTNLNIPFEKAILDKKYIEILESIEKRDKIDSNRKEAPLIIPKEAVIIENTELSKEETVFKILEYIDIK